MHDGAAWSRQTGGLRNRTHDASASLSRLALLLFFFALPARAQDNYEIQVYGSDTVAPHSTMVEIHSNFTVDGSKKVQDGMLPTNHAEHETLEITQGINDWSEVGFYVFSSIQPDGGWQWVGDHIRPRVRGEVALARRREPVDGNRLSARALFRPTPGPGKSAPSSTRKSAPGT